MLVSQAEVAFVMRFVHGLLHGTQQHGLQQFLIFAVFKLGCQLGIIFRRRFVTTTQSQTQAAELFAQSRQFFRGWAQVVAVQRAVFIFEQEVRSAHISRQHTFFNQLVRIVAGYRHNTFDFTVIVKNHLRFNGFKFHRTALAAFFLQHAEELVKCTQLLLKRMVTPLLQPIPHLIVGEACVRFHHRRIETVVFHIAGISDFHITHHAQALDFGVERTNAVGEIFRQHRNHPTREVHAGGAFVSVYVQRLAGAYIMADIGNRHHQAEIAAHFFGIHRIVKIACSFTVYGNQRQVA